MYGVEPREKKKSQLYFASFSSKRKFILLLVRTYILHVNLYNMLSVRCTIKYFCSQIIILVRESVKQRLKKKDFLVHL